jgi:hypothetical protein
MYSISLIKKKPLAGTVCCKLLVICLYTVTEVLRKATADPRLSHTPHQATYRFPLPADTESPLATLAPQTPVDVLHI